VCLAIPMEVKSLAGDRGEVESGGVRYQVSFRLLPDVKQGDFVIVHAGFAIQRLDTEDAAESIRLFRELDALEDGTGNR
jgi:hydrogenase expression/formation protein HypC